MFLKVLKTLYLDAITDEKDQDTVDFGYNLNSTRIPVLKWLDPTMGILVWN